MNVTEEKTVNRFVKIFRGIGRAPESREFKEAHLELERLSAPLVAFLVPALIIAVLFVVTALGEAPVAHTVQIVSAVDEEPPLDDPPEPPNVSDPSPDPATDIDVTIDLPNVADVPQPVPVDNPTPKEPLPGFDAITTVKSVTMLVPTGFGGRGLEARRRATSGNTAGGGSVETERAVLKALRWLKKTQRSDGSWAGPSPAAMAGFAVLTYLAHGEKPEQGEFGETVRRAIDYLTEGLTEVGGVTKIQGSDGNEYAFLIATYALCEAYGMTRHPNVGEAAEKGLRRIIRGQSPTGGWDYKLNPASTRDDLSYGGWALQALKAGAMAGMKVEGLEPALKKAVHYLRARAFKNGGFGYCAGQNPNGLTGTGCLALQLLGERKAKEVRAALDYMRAWKPVWERHPGGKNAQYYSYYATQCKYQAGMGKGATPADVTAWKKWNAVMKTDYPHQMITLKETIDDQNGRPCPIGYWQNKDAYHDPVMGTCLCALQLMVYYRYLTTTSLKASEVGEDIAVISTEANDVAVRIDI